ncbi:hypothetical protein [Aldersonia kunmingensis]|nr:hypothetical protein [Aldersonia kunmingensis]
MSAEVSTAAFGPIKGHAARLFAIRSAPGTKLSLGALYVLIE